MTIGPVIQNGFYYDFARKEPFTEEDLKNIEDKMKEIVDRDEKTKREVWDRDKAIQHFKKKGEIYKAELIENIPKGEELDESLESLRKNQQQIIEVSFDYRVETEALARLPQVEKVKNTHDFDYEIYLKGSEDQRPAVFDKRIRILW